MNRPVIGAAALALLLSAAPAVAQDDSNARILAAVDAFLLSLNETDADKMNASTSAEGIVGALIYDEGKTRYRTRTFAQSSEGIAKETDTLHEVYWSPTVLAHKGIAVVWAPYSFDHNGKRSHCGVDVFNLMQIDGAWKVTGIQYTVEPDGCPKDR